MENSLRGDQFVQVLHARINDYFKDRNLSVKADKVMYQKLIICSLWWLLSYIAILLFSVNELAFFLLYLFHGCGHIVFSFNVGHDALHGAISKDNKINKLWSYSYDLLGVNTYMWRFMHHQGHHACLNVYGEDMSLETAGFFRLSSRQDPKFYHKYQHYYALIIYGLYLLYYVFYKDYKYFFSKNNIHLKNVKHPLKEWLLLFTGKGIYVFYMLVLPLLLLPISPWFVCFTFVFTLFMIGIIMSLTFQTTHIIDSTYYPAHKTEYENYVYHVFATTADYAAENPVANWFFGGLNVHVVHHLRADICHTHYPNLTKIVKATAAEFGVKYRENKTIFGAAKSHLQALKRLGDQSIDYGVTLNEAYRKFIKERRTT